MADSPVDQKLVAILAADVAGYSRLMEADERATVTTLDVYRTVFRERVAAHGGRIVDTAGDSVLAVFPSAIGAVEAAKDIQKDLGNRNDALPEQRRMRFRIGVNLGDVIEKTDGSVYGSGVNVAARLESLAEPGGVTISEDIFRQVEGKIDLGFQDIGEHEVKNIARPVRAYRAAGVAPNKNFGQDKTLALPDRPSIAVMPFTNLSSDPEQEYFADGIAEDLITALSRIRWLFVIARNSTFAYKGKSPDIRQVGRELGVRYVLEGSVRRGGRRIRVSAQLIDATNGAHVWAERYDRELDDLFDLQDEITGTIAATIEPEIGAAERDRANRRPPGSLDAWETYQRGLWHMYHFDEDNNREAQRLFEQASALDPNFAPSFAGLGWTYYLDYSFSYVESTSEALDKAMAAASRAIAIDDKDAMAHTTLGRVFSAKGDFGAALAECKRAIALNPNLAQAHISLGLALVWQGERLDDAITATERALRLSPYDPYIWLFDAVKSYAHFLAGRYEEAVHYAQESVRRPNAAFHPYVWLAAALGQLGRVDEGREVLDKLMRIRPDFSPKLYRAMIPWPTEEPHERIVEGLRKAGLDIPDEPAAAD